MRSVAPSETERLFRTLNRTDRDTVFEPVVPPSIWRYADGRWVHAGPDGVIAARAVWGRGW